MEAFLQTLLTMSATAAVVALVVMVLRLPLKKVPRWVTCALWGVVLLRMVLPAGLSLPVSLVPQGVSSGAYVERVLPAAPQTDSRKEKKSHDHRHEAARSGKQHKSHRGLHSEQRAARSSLQRHRGHHHTMECRGSISRV